LSQEQREQRSELLRTLLLSFEPLDPEDPQHPSHWPGASLASAHVARQMRWAAGLSEIAGLLIQAVAVPGPSAQAGLREGDLIVAANGKAIRSIEDLYEQLRAAGQETVLLDILRGEQRLALPLLPNRPLDAECSSLFCTRRHLWWLAKDGKKASQRRRRWLAFFPSFAKCRRH
jgi:predicted metalloprotease with PDZ domain